MTPFFDQRDTSSVVSFIWNNDAVHFSEIMPRQLVMDGSDLGTPESLVDAYSQGLNDAEGVDLGAVLR